MWLLPSEEIIGANGTDCVNFHCDFSLQELMRLTEWSGYFVVQEANYM
jgi:hypothetical protein